jgi:hypothetical protein
MNKFLIGLTGAAALIMASSAGAALKLDVGGTVVEDRTDLTGLDENANGGVVKYSGDVSGFLFQVSVGNNNLSFPGIFDLGVIASSDSQALAAVNNGGTAPAYPNPNSVTIKLTQTDLTGFGSAGFTSGGNIDVNASVDFDLYMDAGNSEFGTTTYLGGVSGASGVGYNADLVPEIFGPLGSPFSLTLVVTMTATNYDQGFSTDTQVNVPEPSVLALVGMGLVGMGLARRRMKK